jgi:hypothetical protein
MRPLFVCLFLSLSPAISSGQDCHSSCPGISCSGGTDPVCTDSGHWVCPCTAGGLDTCYNAWDCGGEGYSCVEGCCQSSDGCENGACLSADDCGTSPSEWYCSDGCCEWTGGGYCTDVNDNCYGQLECCGAGGDTGGGGGTECTNDFNCPAVKGAPTDTASMMTHGAPAAMSVGADSALLLRKTPLSSISMALSI